MKTNRIRLMFLNMFHFEKYFVDFLGAILKI